MVLSVFDYQSDYSNWPKSIISETRQRPGRSGGTPETEACFGHKILPSVVFVAPKNHPEKTAQKCVWSCLDRHKMGVSEANDVVYFGWWHPDFPFKFICCLFWLVTSHESPPFKFMSRLGCFRSNLHHPAHVFSKKLVGGFDDLGHVHAHLLALNSWVNGWVRIWLIYG